MPDANESMFFIANPTLSPPIVGTTVGILVAVGMLAGTFPAHRSAGMDPVESLRFE